VYKRSLIYRKNRQKGVSYTWENTVAHKHSHRKQVQSKITNAATDWLWIGEKE